MKNKGLLIALAAVGIIAIISTTLFLGFYWGRGWFGGGCCGGWSSGDNLPRFGRGMMWGGSRGWFDGRNSWRGGRGWFRGDANWSGDSPSSARVLSIEEAETAVNAFIAEYRAAEELIISEIMIFDNHAYAEVIEEDTGIGAFEVLVDPVTLAVIPEMGPNMMWNLKYSHMRGGMMGSGYYSRAAEMPISDEEAVEIANAYLSQNNSDLVAGGHADRFYGYYTIHTERDGKIYGMLSVNGYDGKVFLHTWHGEFIEMAEYSEEGHQD